VEDCGSGGVVETVADVVSSVDEDDRGDNMEVGEPCSGRLVNTTGCGALDGPTICLGGDTCATGERWGEDDIGS